MIFLNTKQFPNHFEWIEKYFENQELERIIKQDLLRIYPEHPFFSQEIPQNIMAKVLFIWSKENPNPSYRQGKKIFC